MTILVVALACPIRAQTYKVAPSGSAKPQTTGHTAQTPSQPLGFGSNIVNARLARAAELALQHGDHAQAVDYAQRAAQGAPNDAQLWFLLGYAARLDGKYSLSVSAYTRGLGLSPGKVEGLSGLAQTYSIMGETDDAEKLLKQAIASNPRRRDDVLLLGSLYLKSGDYTNALNLLGRAERMQPDARSELLLAIAYQHLKRMDMASRYLNMAKQRAPNNPDVLRSLAGYYRETGNYSEALAALQSIRNPKPDVVAELAYTYQLDGKLDQSAKLYARAAGALPRNLTLQLSAAEAQIAAGSIEGAEPFLRRAAALSPDYYRLHAIRAQIAQLQGHDDDAVREYSAALVNLPATPVEGPLYPIQLHMNLMNMYRALDDEKAFHRQLQIAQAEIGALDERGADRAQFLRLRAQIKMNAGELDSALADMKEALAISPHDPSSLQLDGDLLMKLGRTEDAIAVYKRVLAIDPKNRFALISMGYAWRAANNDRNAEKYFNLLAKYYPNLDVSYLALGDLYTARDEYKKALAFYEKGYAVAPNNALIVAGGMNAAIEAHDLPLAAIWLGRVTEKMKRVPQVLAEKERYFYFKGDFRQSAELGRQAIEVLPHNRDVVVYLGYDLLNLEKYDELLALTGKYGQSFPKEPDIPLLTGYVHKQNGQLDLALKDFTEALDRDPTVVTAYVNRGYVLNDLHQPEAAAADFEAALKREPKNGVAHLGLAYADLELNRSHDAVRESLLAEKEMGDSEPLHLIRATAYGREGLLTKAADEYRAAIKFSPNDGSLYLGLANTQYGQRLYHNAVDALLMAKKLSPDNAPVSALLARTYAHLRDRDQTMRYVQLAERQARQTPASAEKNSKSEMSAIYVETGQALSTLGDEKAAMDRFRKALVIPNSDRVNVRLAIARVMAQQEQFADAQRQIALAQMEADAGVTTKPSGDQYIAAGNVFLQMHEYQLAETYFGRARAAGASDLSVRIGLANTYLALGDTARAAAELAAVENTAGNEENYAYLLAQANVYEQQHQGTLALTAFARAANDAGEDQTVQQALLQAGGSEGYRINPTLSLIGNFSMQGIFDDTTVYVLDSKLFGPTPVPPSDLALLPPPRSALQTEGTVAYHLHLNHLPTAGGFFQIRNARGVISVPQTSSALHADTYDYTLNFGLDPTIHLGKNALTFASGIQGTIRRDSISPVQLNQNLFRAFTYVSTSSFFNVISASGYVLWQTGPFTESDLHSRTLAGAIDFRVGEPWAKTALVTGWGANDQQFSPIGTENYYTGSYVGLTHQFSRRLKIEGLVEDLRAWRVFKGRSGIAQAIRPAATVNFAPTTHWSLQGSTAYSDNRSYHVYDATENDFSVSYTRPFGHEFGSGSEQVPVRYPLRFSAGFQQETFFNFTPGKTQQLRPYISVTLF